MTSPAASAMWMIRLDAKHVTAAAALRVFSRVEVLADHPSLWLRGPCDAGPIQRAMWILPGERFHFNEKAQLIPWNDLLPVMAAPTGTWIAIAQYFAPVLAPGALPGDPQIKVSLKMVRAARDQPGSVLRVKGKIWSVYVNAAPSVRLTPLQFALSEEGAVLVRGSPLPGLPGVRYTLEDGIALPCGYDFDPAVSLSTVGRLLGLKQSDVALFDAEGSYALIAADDWIPVSRSAVRISLEGLAV